MLPRPPGSSISPVLTVVPPAFRHAGSRWKALAIATASGLSEPLGALLALVVVRPFLTEERLQVRLLSYNCGVLQCG